MGKDKEIETCSCSLNDEKIEEAIDIQKMTDCPHCGLKFSTPNELFSHVFIFHSS